MAQLADQITFHRELYSKAGVDSAVEAYAGLASIEVSENGEQWVATVQAHNPELEEQVVDHFANHVLHMSLAGREETP